MPRLTPAQLDRRTYLGASDIAVLAGVSPWQTPFELYLEKIGELDRDARRSEQDLARMERGHRLEDVALDWHAELTGISIERVRRDVRHPRLPFVIVHPDARVRPWSKSRKLLEAKTAARRWDEVPRHVEAQVQAQMAATGAQSVDVVCLGFDGPPVIWTVERHPELIEALEQLATDFWGRVERRDPPPIDGGREVGHWLDRMFREGPEERADASQADAIARLLRIRAELKRLEAEDAALVNALKWSMAGGSRMYAPGIGRVLWTAPSSRQTPAWKEIAAALRHALEAVDATDAWIAKQVLNELGVPAGEEFTDRLDALEAMHTTTAEGIRQFRVTPAKPAQEDAA